MNINTKYLDGLTANYAVGLIAYYVVGLKAYNDGLIVYYVGLEGIKFALEGDWYRYT